MELHDFIQIGLSAFFSIVVLFIATKLMGNRQMSQLSMFDYVNGITIGSIAAEMATAQEDLLKPLFAIVVYAAITVLISFVTSKSLRARRVLSAEAFCCSAAGSFIAPTSKRRILTFRNS